MNVSRGFESAAGGFLCGIAITSLMQVPRFIYSSFILVALGLLCSGFIYKRSSVILICACFCIGTLLGIARYQEAAIIDRSLLAYVGSTTIEGMVEAEPDLRQDGQYVVVDAVVRGARGKVLVVTERYPRYVQGEAVTAVGVLEKPTVLHFEGRDFDYAAYLEQDGVVALMRHPRVTSSGIVRGSFVATLTAFKRRFVDSLSKQIPEPEASYIAGILVGEKHGLSAEWLNRFRDAGLIHVVVLSGYNVTIIAEVILWLLSYLLFIGRGVRSMVAACCVFIFALTVGPTATVVRASVMAFIVLLAKATGRVYGVKRALLVAAVVMVFMKPKSLLFDVSFELSFLATIALVYVSPLVEPIAKKVVRYAKLREMLVSTVSTQCVVLPLILYSVGIVSLVAPISNILVLPLIPLTMLAGFLSGFCGMFSTLLASPFSFFAYVLSHCTLVLVRWFSHIPYSAVSINHFPLLGMVIAYVCMVCAYIWYMKTRGVAAGYRFLFS